MPLLQENSKVGSILGVESYIAGIDLGSHSSKIVIARDNGASRTVVAAARLAHSHVDSGATIGLRKWLKGYCAYPLRNAYCVLSPTFAEYEVALLPDSHKPTIGGATDAIQQLLGTGVRDVSWDYWESSQQVFHDNREALHLVWVRSQLANQIPQELFSDGIVCETIDAPPAALAGVLNSDESRSLVVDLGHSCGSFALVQNSEVLYARHRVGLSAGNAIAALAESLGVSSEAAETYYSEWGCHDTSSAVGQRVSSQIAPWLHDIQFEIERTLKFIEHRAGDCVVDEIVLVGGGACLRGLVDWLQERLSIPVSISLIPNNCIWNAILPFDPGFALAAAQLSRRGR